MTEMEFNYPFAKSLEQLLSGRGVLALLAMDPAIAIACLLATLQHTIYASVFLSRTSARFISSNHGAFVPFCYFLKILTVVFLALGAWSQYGPPVFATTHTSILIAAAFFLVYGCHLNIMVHHLLGTTGIYYGVELGFIDPKKIVWVTGYPYSLISHPQYVGASMQLIGGALMWGFDASLNVRVDIFAAAVYMSALYLVTIQIEKLPSALVNKVEKKHE
jgi:methylene-fatty-acyl-phospholipid synthase